MTHQITIQLPDAVFQPLVRKAQESGQTVEAVAEHFVAAALSESAEYGKLRRWSGAFNSGIPDAGLRHNDHIGDALVDELRGKEDA